MVWTGPVGQQIIGPGGLGVEVNTPGLTHDDREWIIRHLELAGVDASLPDVPICPDPRITETVRR